MFHIYVSSFLQIDIFYIYARDSQINCRKCLCFRRTSRAFIKTFATTNSDLQFEKFFKGYLSDRSGEQCAIAMRYRYRLSDQYFGKPDNSNIVEYSTTQKSYRQHRCRDTCLRVYLHAYVRRHTRDHSACELSVYLWIHRYLCGYLEATTWVYD